MREDGGGAGQPSFTLGYQRKVIFNSWLSDAQRQSKVYTLLPFYLHIKEIMMELNVSGMLSIEVIVLITASMKLVSSAIIQYDSMSLLGDFLVNGHFKQLARYWSGKV